MDATERALVASLLPEARPRDLPAWTVRVDGDTLGTVRQVRIGSKTSRTFFHAYGIDPSGVEVSLESGTDFDERAAKLVAFHDDPEPFRGVHWHPRRAIR